MKSHTRRARGCEHVNSGYALDAIATSKGTTTNYFQITLFGNCLLKNKQCTDRLLKGKAQIKKIVGSKKILFCQVSNHQLSITRHVLSLLCYL